MAARKQPPGRLRLRNTILEVQQSFKTDPKPPEVISRFMTRHWSYIYSHDEAMVREGFLEGLGRLVRSEMHAMAILRYGDVPDDDSSDANDQPDQLLLELWSEEERDIAMRIGVPSFYVPSRGTYVPLHDPKLISNTELAEGIEHLRKYARGLDNRAHWGEQLLVHRGG